MFHTSRWFKEKREKLTWIWFKQNRFNVVWAVHTDRNKPRLTSSHLIRATSGASVNVAVQQTHFGKDLESCHHSVGFFLCLLTFFCGAWFLFCVCFNKHKYLRVMWHCVFIHFICVKVSQNTEKYSVVIQCYTKKAFLRDRTNQSWPLTTQYTV